MTKHNPPEVQFEKEWHISWYIIVYKLMLGLIEFGFALGIGLFGKQILHIYGIRVSQELIEDPHDLLARLSLAVVPHLFAHNIVLAGYLLILGGAKIAGAIGLIFKQDWGVDLLVGLTTLMLPFQLINLVIHPAWFDFGYIVLGLLIALYLIEFKPRAWISRVLSTRLHILPNKTTPV